MRGFWPSTLDENEGAKLWLSRLIEVSNRGLHHMFAAFINGCSRLAGTIRAALPPAFAKKWTIPMPTYGRKTGLQSLRHPQ
jgi:hypothetical protein